MPRKPTGSNRVEDSRWDLVLGEDTYAGQNAQNPATARQVQSFIPQDDGQLHRELVEPTFASNTLTGPVCGLYSFNQNNGIGGVVRTQFAAARTNFTVGTKTCNFYQLVAGAWSAVAAVGTLADAPQCVTLENNFFLSDGVTNWLYNGTIWVNVGFKIPLGAPAINVTQGSNQVVFIGGASAVTATFYRASYSGQHGECGITRQGLPPVLAGPVTNNSVLFNPPQLTGSRDPNVHPMQWATIDANGNITGYITPNPLDTDTANGHQAIVTFSLYFPAPGLYQISLLHDDGAFFGMGPGSVTGAAPVKVSGPYINMFTNTTPTKAYPNFGGTNQAANNGSYNDIFTVQILQADTYGVEIAYRNWQNNQDLMFLVNGATPVAGSAASQGVTANVGRYYWYTDADQTTGVVTESSSSAIGTVSGASINATINVYQQPGLTSSNTANANITGSASTDSPGPIATAFASWMVGMNLWINGTLIGKIQSVTDSSHLVLTANALATITNGRPVIADPRSTHWHIYASETDGSKVGQYLATVPVTQNLSTTPYQDTSPFIDNVANTFLPIYRPVRNDMPPPSKILEVHKSRMFRRREAKPNFFNFTANEEVTSGNNGDPAQCMPGADVNTISDMVNETSYPDQSARIRSIIAHMDALYLFSEKQTYPLYGQSVDDFSISQYVTFQRGIAGRFAGKSTSYGLAFVTYDRKAVLYPSSYYANYLAEQMDTTSQLLEIGKPMRNKLLGIDPTRLDEVVSEFYLYGIRAWWIVSYPLAAGGYQCYVYDFGTHIWFQLQRGFASLAAMEVSEGIIVLVGGDGAGNTYVIDDQSGTYNQTGTYPQATFRTALIDFGNPNIAHVFRYLELEFNSAQMAKDTTITVWYDPVDVDNPGVGKLIPLRPAKGANRYRAWSEGAATCQRMLLQIQTRSSTNAGVIRGIKLAADPVTGVLPSDQAGGV